MKTTQGVISWLGYDQPEAPPDSAEVQQAIAVLGFDPHHVWFTKHYRASLTVDFAAWWRDFYGTPADYQDTDSEQDEYYTRMGFALLGWRAAKGLPEGDNAAEIGTKGWD